MTVLLLRLAGPMQSWGTSSRFTTRETRLEPSKSGVLGLLAAAQGRPRDSDLSDLAALRFGVRVDQPGTVMVDFQTAQDRDGGSLPLSHRYYIADAAFLAGVEGDPTLLGALARALESPEFPLFLGRRGYPASHPVGLGLRDTNLLEALRHEGWQAAPWHRKRLANQGRGRLVRLSVLADSGANERGESVRDVPLSFNPEHRQYSWRDVTRSWVEVTNPLAPAEATSPQTPGKDDPDWIGAIGGPDVSV